jgi:hypothetical protein
VILCLFHPPYEIGAHRHGCNDGNGDWQADQPFVLLRESTLDEWITYCRAECGPGWPRAWQIREAKKLARFFEVSMD